MTNLCNYDIEKSEDLYSYFLTHQMMNEGESFESKMLTGGVSNRTVLVTLENEQYVVKQGLAKLRVTEDWFSDPERIHTEGRGMIALNNLLPEGQVPEFIYLDKKNNILIMKAIENPHDNFKDLLLTDADHSKLVKQMAELLASIHTASWNNKKLKSEFIDQKYFYQLRINPFFKFTIDKYAEVSDWFDENIFKYESIRNSLVHGDFSPKNILVKNDQLILLDHEVIHYGDFAFDYGFSMAHLFLKGLHLESKHALKYSEIYSKVYINKMNHLLSEEDILRAQNLFLACVFARVAGKSKTNYLDLKKEKIIKKILLKWFSGKFEITKNINKKLLNEVLNYG